MLPLCVAVAGRLRRGDCVFMVGRLSFILSVALKTARLPTPTPTFNGKEVLCLVCCEPATCHACSPKNVVFVVVLLCLLSACGLWLAAFYMYVSSLA